METLQHATASCQVMSFPICRAKNLDLLAGAFNLDEGSQVEEDAINPAKLPSVLIIV